MKTFVSIFKIAFQTVMVMLMVFLISMTTGSVIFASSATIGVGVFSAIMHINEIQNFAFEAPLIPDFTKKTRKEMNELSDDDLGTYLDEKEAFDKATIELKFWEQSEALKKVTDSNPDELKTKLAELETKQQAVIDEHTAMYAMLKGIGEKPKDGEGYKTMGEAILAKLMDNKDELEKLSTKDKSAGLSIVVKQIDMGVQNTIGAGATQHSITEFTGIISTIRKRELTYLANVTVGTVGTDRAYWIEEFDELGAPIFLAEAALKPQASVNYEEQEERVKKAAVHAKITTEFFADLPQLVSFIQNNLMKRLDIVIEDGLFNGDGLGSNLLGGITVATAFTGGSLADEVDDANDADVVEAIRLQAEEAFHMPNAVFVHPSVVSRIRLLKGSDGHYLIPRFVSDDQMNVGGLRLIKTTAVAADEFLGGDLTILQVLIREEIGFEMGLVDDDFITNLRTILAEKRLVQFASVNDLAGLITGTFTAAKALLETP